MKNSLVWIIVVILLAVAGFFLYASQSNDSGDSDSPTPTPTENPEATQTPSPQSQDSVKEFIITGSPFKFDITEIKIKKGDRVRIIFKNAEGFHDWTIDEFNAQTEQIQAGQQDSVEFIADKSGQFEYYCSVGTHRQMGMKGTLIVE